MSSKEDGRKEREARSLALERAYVHDVYDQISSQFSHSVYRAWPRVSQFLETLEQGALVADIGCGNGKYLNVNTKTFNIGADRCSSLANRAQETGNQVILSDNMCLPFRDNGFDACISIAVIHHFATTERRVCALRELARILKIGGRLMITVWAMEQSQRKFESQDVLVPWHRPSVSLTDEKSGSIDRDRNCATSEDESLQRNAYLRSDSCSSPKYDNRKSFRRRKRSRGGSEDSAGDELLYPEFLLPGLGSYSPQRSEVTSPKESCYSFVRRALQKLTSSRRGPNGKPWLAATKGLSSLSTCNEEFIIDAFKNGERRFNLAKNGSGDSQDNIDDVPIELRHLEPDDLNLLDIPPTPNHPGIAEDVRDPKCKNAIDSSRKQQASSAVLSENSPSMLGSRTLIDSESSTTESINNVIRSKSSSSCLSLSSRTNISSPVSASGLSLMSSDSAKGHDSRSTDSGVDEESFRIGRKRPVLKKQKTSINEVEPSIAIDGSKTKQTTEPNTVPIEYTNIECVKQPKPSIVKQHSLNDEIIYIDRFIENEKIKQRVQKQCSLNEDLIYGNTHDKEVPLRQRIFKSQYRHFQAISERFQKLRVASLDRFEREPSDSFRAAILKLLQSWKSEWIVAECAEAGSNQRKSYSASADFLESINRGKLYFENKFMSTAANLPANNLPPDGETNAPEDKYIFSGELSDRKSSREESSDSSKENSFQSDTSLDSEDSCISVIFVPKPGQINPFLPEKERNRSVSSESSDGSDKPNSPKSPKSPGNTNTRYFTGSKYLGKKSPKSSILLRNEASSVDSCISSIAYVDQTKVKISHANCSIEEQNFTYPKVEKGDILPVSGKSTASESTLDKQTIKYKDISNVDMSNTTFKSAIAHNKNIISLKKKEDHKFTDNSHSTRKESEMQKDAVKKEATKEYPNKYLLNVPVDNQYTKHINVASNRKCQTSQKTVPKYLTFEVFNPETDDLDSDSSSSSSPASASSVIELGWPTAKEIEELDKEIKKKEEEERNKEVQLEFCGEEYLDHDEIPKLSLVEPVHRMDTISEETYSAELSRSQMIKRLQSGYYQLPKEYHSAIRRFESIPPVIGRVESLKLQQSGSSSGAGIPCTLSYSLVPSLPKPSIGVAGRANTIGSSATALDSSKSGQTMKKTDSSSVGDLAQARKVATYSFPVAKYGEQSYSGRGSSTTESASQQHRNVGFTKQPSDSAGYTNIPSGCITLPEDFLSSSGGNFSQNNSKELIDFRSISKGEGHLKDETILGSGYLASDPSEQMELGSVESANVNAKINKIGENTLTAHLDKTVPTTDNACSNYPSQYSTPIIQSKHSDTSAPASFNANVNANDKTYESLRSSSINDQVNISKKIIQIYKKDDNWLKEHREPSQRVACDNCKRLQESTLRSIVSEWQDPAGRKITDKTTAERRKMLRQQSSLDSAQERRDIYCRGRLRLSRSGSLDLSSSSRSTKSLSKDDSLSTSQDSLQSDMGGAPTLHRYYHVFKEGELDQLIEKYVHNLHIISSYYDHANWCIIAEKVQVWTI